MSTLFMNIYRCFIVLPAKLNLYFCLRNLVHGFKKKILELEEDELQFIYANLLSILGLLESVGYDLCCLEFKETLLFENSFLYV